MYALVTGSEHRHDLTEVGTGAAVLPRRADLVGEPPAGAASGSARST